MIKRLVIFGIDIAEYTVEYSPEHNENMLFAIRELCRLIEIACGTELTAVEGYSDGGKRIVFRFSDDTALKHDGYRYFEEKGCLVFEGAYKRGCMNAVYRFLQNECGWECLTGGDSYLHDSDYINIPSGIYKTETPAFEYLKIHTMAWEQFKNERAIPTDAENSYGVVTEAHHGMERYTGRTWRDGQICYSDQSNYTMIRDLVIAEIEGKLAAGQKLGREIIEVDIAQVDSDMYCQCEKCRKIMDEENGANAGPVVRFANRLSEELNEKYPGLTYKIFAYHGSNVPPNTAPNEYVSPTFAFDIICANHPVDGTMCDGETFVHRSNRDYAAWFEEWCKLTPNMYVWHYALDENLQPFTSVHNIYRDFRYFYEHGVRGVFYQNTYHGMGIKRIEHQLVYEFNWNPNMTEDEFIGHYHRLLKKEYGFGWEHILQYIDFDIAAQRRMGCWATWSWNWTYHYGDQRYDTTYVRNNFPGVIEILEEAIAMAETDDQRKRCELLLISALYKGCYSSYYHAYEAGDENRLDLLRELFGTAMKLLEKHGFESGSFTTVDGFRTKYHTDLDDAAWIDWLPVWDKLCPGHTREMPNKYVQ